MRKLIYQILKILVIALVLGVIVVAPYTVPTTSMNPTVEAGDYVLVNKFRYGITSQNVIPILGYYLPYKKLVSFGLPNRGDVVVYMFPGFRDEIVHENGEQYLKRCIALAGDTIFIRDDSVFVNGNRSPSDTLATFTMSDSVLATLNAYSRYTTFPRGNQWTVSNYGPLRIPKSGDTLLLDRQGFRGWSVFIAREGHVVDESARTIDGHPATQYVVERDYVFCMGDNRHASLDSRFSGVIASDNVFGSPIGVLLSTGKQPYPRFVR